jgi:hypothetical protein
MCTTTGTSSIATGMWSLMKSKFKRDKKPKEEIKHEPHIFGDTQQCWQHICIVSQLSASLANFRFFFDIYMSKGYFIIV